MSRMITIKYLATTNNLPSRLKATTDSHPRPIIVSVEKCFEYGRQHGLRDAHYALAHMIIMDNPHMKGTWVRGNPGRSTSVFVKVTDTNTIEVL